ncbi:cytochrome c maturation protein CcmE [Rhodobacteraceae bacterium RKSG542]|uniref:cytochrome c maturation protein CcmE n=1 Tax=Pseudovibrio flavus TaxID=2529854 RepID=UPI0012BBB8BB|nr:cytochrome c maturation protein CcmE [Pseudovibrio flavus]MTI17044.1 cytochrome c maturation protein CcmE [Pseudovibrio flavus]
MTRKQRRLTLIGLAGVVIAVATGLILYALDDKIAFFQSPSDIAANQIDVGQRIRLGGLVSMDSVETSDSGSVSFKVEDGGADIKVVYVGILPDLFREGQGIVAEGFVDEGGVFRADQVLAKHDENYMPKEVYEALKEQDHVYDDETLKQSN